MNIELINKDLIPVGYKLLLGSNKKICFNMGQVRTDVRPFIQLVKISSNKVILESPNKLVILQAVNSLLEYARSY